MNLRSPSTRPGLTLLEVVVAMAIFLISLGAIYQLVSLGGDRAVDVKVQSRASLRCQSKLNEVVSGLFPLSSGGGYASDPDDTELPPLEYKIEADLNGEFTNLWNVKVSARIKSPSGRTIETQLAQMVFDPTMRGSTLDQPNASTLPTTPSSGSNSNNANSSSSTTPAAWRWRSDRRGGRRQQ